MGVCQAIPEGIRGQTPVPKRSPCRGAATPRGVCEGGRGEWVGALWAGQRRRGTEKGDWPIKAAKSPVPRRFRITLPRVVPTFSIFHL